jgi:phage baseplate assembly protein W
MAVVLRAERYSSSQIKTTIYQDLFSNVLFNNDTKDINLLSNEDAVKQSIVNIMLTNVGERPFNPTFGSEVNKILFENITPQTTNALIDLISSAIENFEPRANLLDVVASPLPDENAYAVTIVYSVINKTEPITLEFVLNRVR